jgi:cytochrome c oxidase cbb3-type subunit 1
MFIAFACMWLLLGSIAGLTASLKLHWPDWLVSDAWMTFGRIRTIHLTAVLYGWITNAALGIIIWLLPRLLRTRLHGPMWVMMGGALINVGIASAIGAIGSGWTAGMEYLEIPWQIGIFLVAGFVCIIGSVLYTLVNRKVESLYVSVWYHVAALLWISLLFIVAKLPGVHFGWSRPRPTGGTATTCWACGSRRSASAPSTTSCPRSSGGACARTTCRCWASGRWPSSTPRWAATTWWAGRCRAG